MNGKPIWSGTVVALYRLPAPPEAAQSVDALQTVVGRGIEGDWHVVAGAESEEPSYEVTLIESETIESIQYECKRQVEVSLLRRHIITQGFSVSHLVNREFQVGEMRLRGISLYEPDAALMDAVGHKIAIALMHRGGLIAEIVSGGTIKIGDPIHD